MTMRYAIERLVEELSYEKAEHFCSMMRSIETLECLEPMTVEFADEDRAYRDAEKRYFDIEERLYSMFPTELIYKYEV